ncbi:MAG: hypothetical protein ACSHWW_06315 [Nonlabens sp.]|uniref:hypothetical protein n=1 Tax=Nonlabens sp. TaxID=1888209 RepID=UPI003EF3B7B1
MKLFKILCIASLILMSCKDSENGEIALGSHLVNISIEQNGKALNPVDGSIKLDREPFEIVFNSTTPNYILVNASYSDDLSLKAINGDLLTTQPQFTLGHIIAENYHNPEKSIYASSEGSSAWLQESKENHMFNSLEFKDGKYEGTRIIENIFDLDENQNTEIQFIDKPLYLVFLILTDGDLKENQELQRVCLKIEWTDQGKQLTDDQLLMQFNSLLKSTPSQRLPINDQTSFDNRVTGNFLTKKELNTLQLGKIYPNLYTAGYSYKSRISYRLDISQEFETLVVTTQQGDYELETVLINYDLKGKYIDHKVISYDEIADGSNTYQSSIDENYIITKTSIHYKKHKEEPEFYKIDDNGIIKTIYLNEVILTQLDIKPDQVYEDFYSFEEVSNSKTIVFLAKINKQTVDQTDLDAYVLIVNPLTGHIEAQFMEENRWIIDALDIIAIEIEYNPFRVSPDSETIGLKVYYHLDIPFKLYMSNEYNVLVRNGNTLQEILRNFEVDGHHEDFDDQGNSSILENTKTIQPIEDDTSPYYNLEVTDNITEKRTLDGEIDYLVKSQEKEYLKYQSGRYVKDSVQ